MSGDSVLAFSYAESHKLLPLCLFLGSRRSNPGVRQSQVPLGLNSRFAVRLVTSITLEEALLYWKHPNSL